MAIATRVGRLQKASIADMMLFYEWRRQAESRPWYRGYETDWQMHVEWFSSKLENPDVYLWTWQSWSAAGPGLAAYPAGPPSGGVRIESNGELDFYGDEPKMIQEAVKAYGKRVKVTLDAADPRSEVLEAAGFVTFPTTFFCYRP